MYRFSAGAWIFGMTGDRFLLSGYRPDRSVAERLALAATVGDLHGVELNYPADLTDDNLAEVEKALGNTGLAVSMVGIELTGRREWRRGTLSSGDDRVREKAVGVAKKAMDMAAHLGAGQVNLWLGQDGFDYCFQIDYQKAWSHLIASVREIARHRPEVRVCVEYKPKEPRTHALIANAPRALLLVQEVGLPNVGITVDVGHSLNAGENAADAAVLAGGRLFHMHFNDNFRAWDDDLIVGSVHLIEYIELLYWLAKTGYQGWYSLDIFPYREDPVAACRQSIGMLRGIRRFLERVGMDALTRAVEAGDPPAALALLRENLLP